MADGARERESKRQGERWVETESMRETNARKQIWREISFTPYEHKVKVEIKLVLLTT